jgi:hypothetical protein
MQVFKRGLQLQPPFFMALNFIQKILTTLVRWKGKSQIKCLRFIEEIINGCLFHFINTGIAVGDSPY